MSSSQWGKTMTVGELIKELQKFPEDLTVVMHDGEYGEYWDTITVARVKWYDGRETIYLHPFEDDYRNDIWTNNVTAQA